MILHQRNLQNIENSAFFWFPWLLTLGISHTQANATQLSNPLFAFIDSFINKDETEQYLKLWKPWKYRCKGMNFFNKKGEKNGTPLLTLCLLTCTAKKICCMRWQAIVKAANQESWKPSMLESSVESLGQSDSRSSVTERADLFQKSWKGSQEITELLTKENIQFICALQRVVSPPGWKCFIAGIWQFCCNDGDTVLKQKNLKELQTKKLEQDHELKSS